MLRVATRVLLVMVLVLTFGRHAAAQLPEPFRSVTIGRVRVLYPQVGPLDSTLARRIQLAIDSLQTFPGLGRVRTGRQVTVSLVDDSVLPRILGTADPEHYVIILPIHAAAGWSPRRLREVVRHEYAHLQFHDLAAGGTYPAWLEEGYAEWVSASPCQLLLRLKTAIRAWRRAHEEPRLYRTEIISNPRVQYAVYASGVSKMVSQYGTATIPLLLRLSRARSFSDAFELATGVDVAKFESDWRQPITSGDESDLFGCSTPTNQGDPAGGPVSAPPLRRWDPGPAGRSWYVGFTSGS